MITVRVHFYHSVYCGNGGNTAITPVPPTYPPPPSLFIKAAVAMAHAGDESEIPAKLNVLERLCGAPAPSMWAPEATLASYKTFMPGAGSLRNGQDWTIEPHAPPYPKKTEIWTYKYHLREPDIYYTWDLDLSGAERALLSDMVSMIGYLGRTESMCTVEVVADSPAPNLVPGPGDVSLDVPEPGFLQALQHRYDQGLSCHIVNGVVVTYRQTHRIVPDDYPRSTYRHMTVLVHQEGEPQLLTNTVALCRQARKAYLAHLQVQGHGVLHGHTREDHVAWVALPHVGGAYGTGRIMGIAAVLPASLTAEDYQVHMATVQSMANASDGYISQHFRMDYRSKAAALNPQRWQTPSRAWHSVTPVVWVGHPRPNRTERIVTKMCAHIGLPAPKAFQFGRYSQLQGSPYAQAFLLPDHYQHRYVSHMELEFDEPVYGPVLLGSGQYFGLGLFAPRETK